MERIQKAQALGSADKQSYMQARKTFELNPRHPIVIKIHDLLKDDNKEAASEMGRMLFDSALLTSGFQVEDGVAFATRLNKLISNGLGIDPDAPLSPEYELPVRERSCCALQQLRFPVACTESRPRSLSVAGTCVLHFAGGGGGGGRGRSGRRSGP